jgi:hypothetical protein
MNNTYLVKNIDGYPLLLPFADGTIIKLRPNGTYLWQGPNENANFLQEYVDAGKLDVWMFESDFTSQQLVRTERVWYEWLKEGF